MDESVESICRHILDEALSFNRKTMGCWALKHSKKHHLVGGFKVSNMTFIFHSIWDVILPIDFYIFQRG